MRIHLFEDFCDRRFAGMRAERLVLSYVGTRIYHIFYTILLGCKSYWEELYKLKLIYTCFLANNKVI